MTAFPVQVNAWQRDPSVSFAGTQIAESIQVRPSSYAANPAAAAAAVHAAAVARRAEGQRVVFRPWLVFDWGDQPRAYYANGSDANDANNWYNNVGPYEDIVLPAYLTDWFDAFNAEIIALGTNPDYYMADDEKRPDYWDVHADARQAYFAPITIDDANNPYPNDPNPYIGVANMAATSNPLVGAFTSEYNQRGADQLTAGLQRLYLGVWDTDQQQQQQAAKATRLGLAEGGESGDADARPASNYRDAAYTFDTDETSNRPERLPYASTRVTLISAPICYHNRRDLPVYDAEPEYVTDRQIANRERWKVMLDRQNHVRSCAGTEPGDVHPWVQSPGWGWNGGEGWCNATQLAFEFIIWRVMIRHLEEAGVQTYNWWGPIPSTPGSNDPNSAETHAFLAAYWTGKTVGPLVRDLPKLDLAATEFTTGNFTTRESELFGMTTLYYTRSDEVFDVPFLQGWPWSLSNPLVISAGAAGDAELARMKAGIENNQGTTIQTQEVEDDSMPPSQVNDFQVSAFNTATARVLKGSTVRIGGTISPLQGQPLGELAIKAQVRSRAKGTLIHDFAGTGPIPLTVDGDNRTFFAETQTDGWPAGLAVCDLFVVQDGTPYGVGRYQWEIVASVTEGVVT